MHVVPATQAVGPVQPTPPHCPHWLCAGWAAVVVGIAEEVVVVVVVVLEVVVLTKVVVVRAAVVVVAGVSKPLSHCTQTGPFGEDHVATGVSGQRPVVASRRKKATRFVYWSATATYWPDGSMEKWRGVDPPAFRS